MQNNAGIPKFIPFHIDVVFKNINNEIHQQKHSINISKYICNFFFQIHGTKKDQKGMDMLGWSSQHPPPHWLIFCNYGTTWVWNIICVRPRITSFPVVCWKLRCVLCVRIAKIVQNGSPKKHFIKKLCLTWDKDYLIMLLRLNKIRTFFTKQHREITPLKKNRNPNNNEHKYELEVQC